MMALARGVFPAGAAYGALSVVTRGLLRASCCTQELLSTFRTELGEVALVPELAAFSS